MEWNRRTVRTFIGTPASQMKEEVENRQRDDEEVGFAIVASQKKKKFS